MGKLCYTISIHDKFDELIYIQPWVVAILRSLKSQFEPKKESFKF